MILEFKISPTDNSNLQQQPKMNITKKKYTKQAAHND